MNRTLTVKGLVTLSLSPDLVCVGVTLKALDPDYAASSAMASEQFNCLQDRLYTLGFSASDLKTTSLRVSAENESEQDERGRYHPVFRGYAVYHSTELSFPFDPERLGAVLGVLASLPSNPEIGLRFTVSDRESASHELLCLACADAKKKADILASASGVSLGRIVSINYGSSPLLFESRTEYAMDRACMSLKGASNMHITPDAVEETEEVCIVWEIE